MADSGQRGGLRPARRPVKLRAGPPARLVSGELERQRDRAEVEDRQLGACGGRIGSQSPGRRIPTGSTSTRISAGAVADRIRAVRRRRAATALARPPGGSGRKRGPGRSRRRRSKANARWTVVSRGSVIQARLGVLVARLVKGRSRWHRVGSSRAGRVGQGPSRHDQGRVSSSAARSDEADAADDDSPLPGQRGKALRWPAFMGALALVVDSRRRQSGASGWALPPTPWRRAR